MVQRAEGGTSSHRLLVSSFAAEIRLSLSRPVIMKGDDDDDNSNNNNNNNNN